MPVVLNVNMEVEPNIIGVKIRVINVRKQKTY